MSRSRDADYVEHMLDALDKVFGYTQGGAEAFASQTLIQDAVIRNLQVLGEVAKRVSPALRTANPCVPWREAAGLRDVLVHDYFGVDIELVWAVVLRDLPALEAALRSLTPADELDPE